MYISDNKARKMLKRSFDHKSRTRTMVGFDPFKKKWYTWVGYRVDLNKTKWKPLTWVFTKLNKGKPDYFYLKR